MQFVVWSDSVRNSQKLQTSYKLVKNLLQTIKYYKTVTICYTMITLYTILCAQYYIYSKHIHHISQHIIYKLYSLYINNKYTAAPCHERTADAPARDASAICPSVNGCNSRSFKGAYSNSNTSIPP